MVLKTAVAQAFVCSFASQSQVGAILGTSLYAIAGRERPVRKNPFRFEGLALRGDVTLVLVAHGQHPYIYFMVPNHLDPLLAAPHPLAS